MGRLCERPGCSEPASVAYGMRPEDLIFWLDTLIDGASLDGGVLCRRHADTMVVPRNWTLDDLRDPDLHLFRPPEGASPTRHRATRERRDPAASAQQLTLGDTGAIDGEYDRQTDRETDSSTMHGTAAGATSEFVDDPVAVEGSGQPSEPWTPSFDEADDLDGLLSARSPLLARAFRGDDRPRS